MNGELDLTVECVDTITKKSKRGGWLSEMGGWLILRSITIDFWFAAVGNNAKSKLEMTYGALRINTVNKMGKLPKTPSQ